MGKARRDSKIDLRSEAGIENDLRMIRSDGGFDRAGAECFAASLASSGIDPRHAAPVDVLNARAMLKDVAERMLNGWSNPEHQQRWTMTDAGVESLKRLLIRGVDQGEYLRLRNDIGTRCGRSADSVRDGEARVLRTIASRAFRRLHEQGLNEVTPAGAGLPPGSPRPTLSAYAAEVCDFWRAQAHEMYFEFLTVFSMHGWSRACWADNPKEVEYVDYETKDALRQLGVLDSIWKAFELTSSRLPHEHRTIEEELADMSPRVVTDRRELDVAGLVFEYLDERAVLRSAVHEVRHGDLEDFMDALSRRAARANVWQTWLTFVSRARHEGYGGVQDACGDLEDALLSLQGRQLDAFQFCADRVDLSSVGFTRPVTYN